MTTAGGPVTNPEYDDAAQDGEDEWELERKDVTLKEVIGSGMFGEVKRGAVSAPWGGEIEVAVKTSKSNRMTRQVSGPPPAPGGLAWRDCRRRKRRRCFESPR